MSNSIRLGIIGFSPGNGHPYSWSAIFNGYNMAIMEECGFPVIPRYLEKQHYPQDFIQGAKVTHIWTQDQALSRHIAAASKIPHVVDDFHELIDSVDAILLARDDFESHLYFAKPFLQSGMPIYIDKPLAVSVRKARQLLDLQCYPGQLFSCSALKYSNELIPNKKQLSEIGPVQQIFGFSPKAWDTYAIHVIEPILMSLPHDDQLVNTTGWNSSGRTNLLATFSSCTEVFVGTYGDCSIPINIRYIGTNGYLDLKFTDSFGCFKKALEDFILSVNLRTQRITSSSMLRVVSLVEAGRQFQ